MMVPIRRGSLALGLTTLLLTATLLPAAARATTWFPVDVRCPMCRSVVVAQMVGSTSTGGAHADFCPIYLGMPVISVAPTTCSTCLYSGYPDAFDSMDPSKERQALPFDLRRQFLRRDAVVPALPIARGTPSLDVPDWVRQDLVAQTMARLGAPSGEVAQAYLAASWLVRLTASPLAEVPETQSTRLKSWLESTLSSKGAPPVAPGRPVVFGSRLVELSQSCNETDRALACLGALHVLRGCGENDAALSLLPRVKVLLTDPEYDVFRDRVVESINRERRFQRSVLERLPAAGPTSSATGTEDLTMFYLAAELERRLGEPTTALAQFDDVGRMARGMRGVPPQFTVSLARQRALAEAAVGATAETLPERFCASVLRLETDPPSNSPSAEDEQAAEPQPAGQ